MEKIVVIGVYFGRLPAYIDAWIRSVCCNPTVDFLVVTDQQPFGSIRHPDNLRVLPSTLKDFKNLAEQKIGMPVHMETPYKICDFKPIYGLILEDKIRDYDYWGECDFDVIFGDLRFFFEQYEIGKYDKFFNRGHLTLYRNTREVIDRYRLSGGSFGSYKEIFRSDMVWGLDEMFGINRIYEKHGFPAFDEFVIADIDMRYSDLRLVPRNEPHLQNYEEQVFLWRDGKVFRRFKTTDGEQEQEFAYIHLAKRKFPKPAFDIEAEQCFWITKDGLTVDRGIPYSANFRDQSNTVVRKQQTSWFDKKLKFFWIGRRYLNIKHWMRHQ